jgi:hypothetical protein
MKIRLPRWCLLPVVSVGFAASAAAAPLVLQDRRELLVDDRVIERLSGADVRLGAPIPAGVALRFDAPWEGRFSGAFVTVLRDRDKFRLYYRGSAGGDEGQTEVTCYAESDDGVVWRRPNLGLVESRGSRENNIVVAYHPERHSHNFSVLLDDRPGVPAAERFKAVGGGLTTSAESRRTGAVRGLYRFVSADGIHWTKLPGAPLFKGYALDTQNVLTWIPEEQTYAIYLRTWTLDEPGKPKWRGRRLIARSTSPDFGTWTEPAPMTWDGPAQEDLYTNATHPYFRAPQILIALPFRFSPERRLLAEEEMRELDVAPSMWSGVSDAVLLTSRGGLRYERKFNESFIRPGLDRSNWAARSTIPALGVVQTGPDEMSIYVTCGYGTGSPRLERRTLRLDGFAALHAGYEPGFAITKPLRLSGTALEVNFSASSIGWLKVTVLDEQERELPGFGAAEAEELAGDAIARRVSWRGGRSLRELADRTVRLKFELRDADLFSFGAFGR